MTTKYNINGVDLDSLYIRKDLFQEDSMWTWGYNVSGSLGDNTITHRSSPIQTIAGGTNWKSVAGGNYSTIAIKTDGTLWNWGYNVFGQLGINTTSDKSSPVQTVAGGTNWRSAACGNYFTAAIKTDGTLWIWGYNFWGQLGNNTFNNISSPIQTVAGGTNWRSAACGNYFTAAIKTDGTLWTWGQNTDGQLGNNTVVSTISPIQTIAGGTNWKQVACGAFFTTAIKTDGTLWTWGQDTYGQLGDNALIKKSSPVQTIAGGTNWKSVACGYHHTAAIKTDGTLWAWGKNTDGQLGDNTRVHKSSPVQTIAGGTNWKSVSAGYESTAAIKTDGTLWTWGGNSRGQLGDSTTAHKSSPVQTIAGGTNWKSAGSGVYHTIALKDDIN